MGMRIDYRGDAYNLTISREHFGGRYAGERGRDPRIESRWEEVLREHLATSKRATEEDGWKYKQKLVDYFPLTSFWVSSLETIRVHTGGLAQLVSLEEMQAMPVITTFFMSRTTKSFLERAGKSADNQSYVPTNNIYSIIEDDLTCLSNWYRKEVFRGRAAKHIRWVENGYLAIDWELSLEGNVLIDVNLNRFMEVVPLPNSPDIIGCEIHKTTHGISQHVLLNANNTFVLWLISMKEYCEQGKHGLRREQFNTLADMVYSTVRYKWKLDELTAYLSGWRDLPGIPSEFCPPEIELTKEMFVLLPQLSEDSEPKIAIKQTARRSRRQQKPKPVRK
jgi:hypothetical protein